MKLMSFNKAKGKVLHLDWGNPRCLYRLGEELLESSPAKKDLWVLVDEKQHEPTVSPHSLEGQQYPGLHQKRGSQQGEGGDCLSLLCPREALSGVLHPGLGPLIQARQGAVGEGPEECHKDDQRSGAPLL